MRIALAQIRSGTDPAANLQLVGKYAGEAATAGAQLVVFPEATMCRLGVPLRQVAEPVDGPWANGVRRIATEAGITVIAGMFTPTGDGRVTNTLIAAGPGTPNQPDAHYHKIHLYDAFGFTESRTVAPGREPVVVVVDGVRVGFDRLLRHSLSRPLYRAGAARGPTDRGLCILGFRSGQTRTVDVAGPRPGARLHELRRRGRPSRPR
ncbi:amidohydrolase [Mycobacterium tuberculosis RGTB327]|nr:amidohydrolase [Mycobacterium tuberculosis RGTB327]